MCQDQHSGTISEDAGDNDVQMCVEGNRFCLTVSESVRALYCVLAHNNKTFTDNKGFKTNDLSTCHHKQVYSSRGKQSAGNKGIKLL
jgi:hypothetical protein